ncbi:MAG: GerW family sporulation protein [Christensenellales bacterium]
MQDNKIENLMEQAIEKIKKIIDVDTIIGKPINCIDGTMIIPITKVSVGFVAGGGEYSQNIPPKNEQKQYPFAGGSTAGFSINPVGFLIGSGKNIKLVTMDHKNTFEEIVKIVENITSKLK